MIKKWTTTAFLVGTLTIGGVAFAEDNRENVGESELAELVEEMNEVVDEITEEEGFTVDLPHEELELNEGDLIADLSLEESGVEEEVSIDRDSPLYETIRVIEEGEFDLTEDPGEKALLQDEFADKRLEEAEEAFESGNDEKAEELLEEHKQHLDVIDTILEEATENGEDVTEIKEELKEKAPKRMQNLLALLEREHLPEQAKAGIRKAIANQERAMQKAAKARENGKRNKQEVVENSETDFVEESEVISGLQVTEAKEQKQDTPQVQLRVEKKNEKAQERTNEKVNKTLERANQKVEKANENANKAQERANQQAENTQQRVEQNENRGNSQGKENKGKGNQGNNHQGNNGNEKETGKAASENRGNGNGRP